MKVQAGTFCLVADPGVNDHRRHTVTCRHYPDLTPPATFYDCWTCGVTWESGR